MDAIQGSEVLALVGEEILFNWIFGYCVKRQRAPNSFVLEAEVLLWRTSLEVDTVQCLNPLLFLQMLLDNE